ncbi:lysophospholipid acyltransferase family protein [Pedobacter sp. BS3]|uniref:lysophospholipid acyltransferase family protein n=1 Tax=Pedobacter sp. BS3 TaxID=2567937 RepID=UPI00293924C4|nr:lysophospholipid acyltransferase family protein [Pedobacter sp. BS3]
MKKVHLWFYAIEVCLYFFLLYPLLYYFSRKVSRFSRLNKVRRFLGFISSATAGFFYSFSYEVPVDWSKTYIICPNHTSFLDISAVSVMITGNFAFMGKDELLENPVTRLFFKTIDIPLNRQSKISSFRAFKRAETYLKQGISMVIFPEGKIGDTYPPVLHSFKDGPFRLAIEQQIPIVPVTIRDTWKKMWDNGFKYGSRPGICDICVHKPIETSGLTVNDEDSLRETVFRIIQKEFRT